MYLHGFEPKKSDCLLQMSIGFELSKIYVNVNDLIGQLTKPRIETGPLKDIRWHIESVFDH